MSAPSRVTARNRGAEHRERGDLQGEDGDLQGEDNDGGSSFLSACNTNVSQTSDYDTMILHLSFSANKRLKPVIWQYPYETRHANCDLRQGLDRLTKGKTP